MDRKSILEEAEKCVCQSRQEEYGPIEDNFKTIATLWNVYMWSRQISKGSDDGVEITPDDVAVMMCLLKIARISSGQTKDDNYVDIAGYAACAGELATKE